MVDRSLQCSVNQVGCKGKAVYVCHECGRLLCDGPRCCRWGWDDAFVGRPVAYHCPQCDHLGPVGQFVRWLIHLLNQVYDMAVALRKWLKKYILDNLFKFFRFVFRWDRRKKKNGEAKSN